MKENYLLGKNNYCATPHTMSKEKKKSCFTKEGVITKTMSYFEHLSKEDENFKVKDILFFKE